MQPNLSIRKEAAERMYQGQERRKVEARKNEMTHLLILILT
jgi:hypothetical protein